MVETETPDLSYWAEGVTVEGKRMTVAEAREFIDTLTSAVETIEAEERRARGEQ